MIKVTEIFRHPLKSHGRELLAQVTLIAGQSMPWDRRWAVAHEVSNADGSEWAACANFSRGAKAPKLMATRSSLDEATGTLTLSHPERKDFTFQPDDERQLTGFLAWVKPLMPNDRAQSARVVRLPERGFTDTDYASVSINSHASLRDLSAYMERDLSPLRWRGNIWIDGLKPWEENTWVGQRFQIGDAVFEGVEPIGRCLATTVNPETGARDADTLKALNEHVGHQDFGLYAKVITGGLIKTSDSLKVIS